MKKRILKIVSVILILTVIQQILAWALSPVSFARWVNHDIKTHRTEIDTVFFGASHMYIDLDPELFDKESDRCEKTLNCGTTSQTIAESYYYLVDLVSYCPNIKNVFLDTYTVSFMKLSESAGSDLQRKIVLSSRLNNPIYKALYVLTQFKTEELPSFLFKSLYYNDKLYEAGANIRTKLSDDYCSYSHDCTGFYEPYYYMGYVPYNKKGSGNLNLPENFELSSIINEDSFKYLDKMIKFCQKKNLNLYFIQLPVGDDAYNKEMALGTDIRARIDSIIKENKITYIDMNEPEIKYSVITEDDFYDSEHLNINGSQKITEYIASRVNELDRKAI